MKLTRVLHSIAVLLVCAATLAHAQQNGGGILYANTFAGWNVPTGNIGQFSWAPASACTVTNNGITFPAFSVGVPVTLVDQNPALSEIVTVTAVNRNGAQCSIVTSPQVNRHYSFSIQSGTAGLQEAINYAIAKGQGQVIYLTPDWATAGGTTGMITSVAGSTNISILDTRLATQQAYLWNGAAYTAVSPIITGACLTAGCTMAGTISGPTAIFSSITGTLNGAATGNLPLTGGGTVTGAITDGDGFVGPLVGAVTGSLNGPVTGNVTGNVAGTVTGHSTLDLPLTGGALTGTFSAPIISGNVNNWVSPLTYGLPSNGSAATVTATGSGTSITLSSTSDYVSGNGILGLHLGPSCGSTLGLSCATAPIPTVAPQGTTGSTSYSYKLACIDGLGGVGPAGTAGSTATGNATLAGVVHGTDALTGNYNQVTWTGTNACRQVAIWRNNVLIGSQYSGASGTQTWNDIGAAAWTDRDIPASPPGVGLNDNYDGIITAMVGTAATISPALTVAASGTPFWHDDTPLFQAARAVSTFIQIPPGQYTFRYPFNYSLITAGFANAGSILGFGANINCDTNDMCIDMTGDQNVSLSGFALGAGSDAFSSIGLYLARDTSDGDIAQTITTHNLTINIGVQTVGSYSPQFGGRGWAGIYNHAAEIQHNFVLQDQTDRAFVISATDIDNVASLFSPTDDRSSQSMSEFLCSGCTLVGYKFAELDNTYSITFKGGYGLGGFLGTTHPWGFEVDSGQSGRLTIEQFRVEGKYGLISVAAGAQVIEPTINTDLYRVAPFATTAQIWLNNGAVVLDAQSLTIDDYGGSGANVAALVDGVNCAVATSKMFIGVWESVGTCQTTGNGNFITGHGQWDWSLPLDFSLTQSGSGSTWVKLGTWIANSPAVASRLGIKFFSGPGFASGTDTTGWAQALIGEGNNTAAPNLSGAFLEGHGNNPLSQLKVQATGGSTSTSNESWDIFVFENSAFASGEYHIDKAPGDQWINSNTVTSDPGSASSSLKVGAVFNSIDQTGNMLATAIKLNNVTGSVQCLHADASGNITGTGVDCGGSGGAGVTSIDAQTGAFLFNGTGVSHVGNTYTFNGGGGTGTVTSIATTGPITGGTITTTGTLGCPTCLLAPVNPGVGILHAAGGTQTMTSSAVNLGNADITGIAPILNTAAGASSETVTFSATPTFSLLTRYSTITLTANITTFTLAAGAAGQHKVLTFCQNATGGWTATPPANVHGYFTSLGTNPNKCSSQGYNYDASQSAWLSEGPGTINQ